MGHGAGTVRVVVVDFAELLTVEFGHKPLIAFTLMNPEFPGSA